MVTISGLEFTTFQLFLIVALLVIGPAGYLNQKRRLKRSSESVNYYVQQAGGSGFNEDIKAYILKNKSSYSRDAIRTALINAGNTSDEVDRHLKEFF